VAGAARCVVVADTGTVFRAESISISDGRWHRVRCVKSATALSIEVDSTDLRSVPVPAALMFDSPSKPARLGGDNITNNADRYSGLLDDVYYRLG